MRMRLRHRSATSRSTTPSKAFYPALRGRITTAAVPSGAAAVCVNGGTPDFALLCRTSAAALARHPANTSAFPCPPRRRQRQDGACGHSTGKSNPGSLWGFTATQWPLVAAQDQRGFLRAAVSVLSTEWKTGPSEGPDVDGKAGRNYRPDGPDVRKKNLWWILGDSNSRHLPCKGSALPTELRTRKPSEFNDRGWFRIYF